MVMYQDADRPALSPLLPHLYLGAQRDVTKDGLSALGISHVLSVSRCCPQPHFLPPSCFLRVPIDDSLSDQLLPWIPAALAFIDQARCQRGAVLLHCVAGVSRSPALAVAYIMHHLGLGLDDAYRFVKERRPSISPNFNFLGQLQHFQSMLARPGAPPANRSRPPSPPPTNLTNQNLHPPAAGSDLGHDNSNTTCSGSGRLVPMMHYDRPTRVNLNLELRVPQRGTDAPGPARSSDSLSRDAAPSAPDTPNKPPSLSLGGETPIDCLCSSARSLSLSPAPNRTGRRGAGPPQPSPQTPTGHPAAREPQESQLLSAERTPRSPGCPPAVSAGPGGIQPPVPQTDPSLPQTGPPARPGRSRGIPEPGELGVSQAERRRSLTLSLSAPPALAAPLPDRHQGALAGCAMAEEAREDQGDPKTPASPFNLAVSRLVGWGERLLLGAFLGTRVAEAEEELGSPLRPRVGPRLLVLGAPSCKHQVFAQRHLASRGQRSSRCGAVRL
ncbi:dual specificity protein phosphatase 8 [Lepisosteus oculatus]|uniref:dual specificity protein phosphatase 8 n=1 Tax=Lepisosteus oculatus TaxID=7918 RepID=UPI00371F8DA8